MFKEPTTVNLSLKPRSLPSGGNVLDEDSDSTNTNSVIANVAQPEQSIGMQSMGANVDTKESKVSQPTRPNETPNYVPPSWSGMPSKDYYFEILKSGCIVGNFELKDAQYFLAGRNADCPLRIEHPSSSRYHAAIQYRATTNGDGTDVGWYVYDFNSTHGSFINKDKLTPRVYHRIRVGHVVKFGLSTRMYLLQGPETDLLDNDESTLSINQLKLRSARQRMIISDMDETVGDRPMSDSSKAAMTNNEAGGIDWGMGQGDKNDKRINSDDSDDDDEDDNNKGVEPGINFEEMKYGETLEEREKYYKADPKKALRACFERESFEMKFDYTEASATSFNLRWTCKLELPFDSTDGRPLFAEASITAGGKRDAQMACVLEACRILDSQGVLRPGERQGKRKRHKKNYAQNDYYSSDEDEFLDRTEELQKKREARKQREQQGPGGSSKRAETYQSLLDKLDAVNEKMEEIEKELKRMNDSNNVGVVSGIPEPIGGDTLDNYMADIQSSTTASTTVLSTEEKMKKRQLKLQLQQLKKSAIRFKKLSDIAKPNIIPSTKPSDIEARKRNLLGAMRGLRTQKAKAENKDAISKIKVVKIENDSDVSEHDSDDDSDDHGEDNKNVGLKVDAKESELPPASKMAKVEPIVCVKKRDSIDKVYGMEIPPEIQSQIEAAENEVEPMVTEEMKEVEENVEDQTDLLDDTREPIKNEIDHLKSSEIKMKKQRKQLNQEFKSADPKYAAWLPPEGQRGDGKTHLNEKFGY